MTTPAPFDRDYWISHCEGFRVDGPSGRLGFVDHVDAAAHDRVVLAVRAGMLGRRLLLFDAADVDFVVPRARRLWVHATSRILGTHPAPEPAP